MDGNVHFLTEEAMAFSGRCAPVAPRVAGMSVHYSTYRGGRDGMPATALDAIGFAAPKTHKTWVRLSGSDGGSPGG